MEAAAAVESSKDGRREMREIMRHDVKEQRRTRVGMMLLLILLS